MPAVYDDHAESAFWDAEANHVAEALPVETPEEELMVRPEVISLQRWLDLNA